MSTTPTPHPWLSIQAILDRALTVPPEERGNLLDEACAGDDALRREVETYLSFEEQATGFLERPLFDLIAGRPAENRIGEELGPYRLEESIAEGGMGTVYRATRVDGTFEQKVAVKILKRGFDTRAIVRGFRRERQILAGFEHPGITRLIDGGATEDGLPYLVMEDVQGRRLDEYCALHRPSLERRLGLFVDLCTAVQAAHGALVVHCDLKPANILVTAEGELKLLDFGIAKILQGEGEAATRTLLRRLGTPPYASPEQHRGDPVSTSTDVYALGGLLFELLTGEPPRRADQRQPGDPPLRLAEGSDATGSLTDSPGSRGWGWRRWREQRRLRGDLDLIVQKATALESGRRYASAQELGDDVRRFLERRPIQARPESWSYVAGRFVERNPLAVALTVLLISSLAGGATALWFQLSATTEQRDRAVALHDLSLELLEVVDPSRGESASVAVQTAMTELRHTLPELSTDDRATLLDRMGRMLHRQGFQIEARGLLLQALDLRRHHLPWDPEKVAASLNNLALVERELGDTVRAAELLNEALELQRAHGISSEISWLHHLGNLALAIEDHDPERAEGLYRQVIEGYARNLAPKSAEVAAAFNNLGQHLLKRGRYQEATPLLERARDLRAEVLGPEHAHTLSTLNNLSVLYDALGRSDEAIATARELLAQRRRRSGETHRSTDTTRITLAFFLLQQHPREGLEEAENLLRQALENRHGAGEQDHSLTLVAEGHLAAVRLALGHPAETRKSLEDLLPRIEARLGAESWRLADLRSLLGEAHLALGEIEAARPLITDTLPRIVEAKGETSPYTRNARRRLALLEASDSGRG